MFRYALALSAALALTACGDDEPKETDETVLPDNDADDDGWDEGEDCDDSNPAVNPDATETCATAYDDDCDGVANPADSEGCTDFYLDADGDGHGVDDTACLCEAEGEYTASVADDCDDAEATTYPGAADAWYDGVDSDCAGDDDYDQDGDSHVSADHGGDDCDDTDATIHPGAEDTWYDGIDSDCAGNSDYDTDGDGYDHASFGGDDCHDGDATIFPGAEETWYDGVDSDCDGASDYDQDGDGEDHADHGGDDCDDEDADINTSATETYYDGVDSDCDGASDYDADGDGDDSEDWGGDDCDDTDASISSLASEIWYDGTDSDCDGESDYDQDGDGYDSEDYSGTDCDDTDEDVYVGATEEPQDGIDQDCDGEDAPYSLSDLDEGDLIITEVMSNPFVVDDAYGEWFEVYNASGGEVDVDGLVLSDDGTDSDTVSGTLTFEDGEFLVFGRDDDTSVNGDVTLDYEYTGSSLSLGNSDDELILSYGSTTFDEIAWDDGTTFPDDSGYSMTLHDTYFDPDDNDDGASWCSATSTFGDGDFGTPGDANDDCYTYTHAEDIQSIWTSSCASCHGGSRPSGSLDLSSDAYDDIVEVYSSQSTSMYLVDPGSTEDSYLWHKLQGTQSDVDGSGSDMPYSGTLSSTDEATIETWIEEGAPK